MSNKSDKLVCLLQTHVCRWWDEKSCVQMHVYSKYKYMFIYSTSLICKSSVFSSCGGEPNTK